MKRASTLFILAFFLTAITFFPNQSHGAANRPNVVLIISDDQACLAVLNKYLGTAMSKDYGWHASEHHLL